MCLQHVAGESRDTGAASEQDFKAFVAGWTSAEMPAAADSSELPPGPLGFSWKTGQGVLKQGC